MILPPFFRFAQSCLVNRQNVSKVIYNTLSLFMIKKTLVFSYLVGQVYDLGLLILGIRVCNELDIGGVNIIFAILQGNRDDSCVTRYEM